MKTTHPMSDVAQRRTWLPNYDSNDSMGLCPLELGSQRCPWTTMCLNDATPAQHPHTFMTPCLVGPTVFNFPLSCLCNCSILTSPYVVVRSYALVGVVLPSLGFPTLSLKKFTAACLDRTVSKQFPFTLSSYFSHV